MQPKISTNVSNLTKEMIGDLYFQSLGNIETRKTHNLSLLESRRGPTSVAPSVHEVEIDFSCWYGGVLSLAEAVDPGVALPALKEMAGYINQNFERAKTAIAA